MFDILVYLFETYVHAGACPESDQLRAQAVRGGLRGRRISEALSWLDGLRAEISIPDIGSDSTSVRIYADEEMRRLDAECRLPLTFLENAGVLDALTRE